MKKIFSLLVLILFSLSSHTVADEVDIEANIPIGKRNVNSMAILLAIDNYDDISFLKSNHN